MLASELAALRLQRDWLQGELERERGSQVASKSRMCSHQRLPVVSSVISPHTPSLHSSLCDNLRVPSLLVALLPQRAGPYRVRTIGSPSYFAAQERIHLDQRSRISELEIRLYELQAAARKREEDLRNQLDTARNQNMHVSTALERLQAEATAPRCRH